MGTADATKTGFLAHATGPAAPLHTLTNAVPPSAAPAAPTHTRTDTGAGSGMAADVAAAPTDVAPGVSADKGAITHNSNATGIGCCISDVALEKERKVFAVMHHRGSLCIQNLTKCMTCWILRRILRIN